MDGYAVRADDLASPPRTLRVVDDVQAGMRARLPVGAGEAIRVMTGAPLPNGADTVIRIEDTDGGTTAVTVNDSRDARRNVRRQGEDYERGDVLADVGDVVNPALIGVLASSGIQTLSVYRTPRVAIIASGDELVGLDRFDEVLAGERIVSSSSYSLPALVRTAGAAPIDLGIAPDSREALRARVEAAIGSDLIITVGGVSVGDSDHTRAVMEELGAQLTFWRARIRPGGPLAFGIVHDTPWLGLPGNPVSSGVTFELFVRPALLKMRGHTRLFPATVRVKLAEAVTGSTGLTSFLRVNLAARDGALHAHLTGTQSSGALTSLARADALLIAPEGRTEYAAGEELDAIPLGGALRATTFPAP